MTPRRKSKIQFIVTDSGDVVVDVYAEPTDVVLTEAKEVIRQLSEKHPNLRWSKATVYGDKAELEAEGYDDTTRIVMHVTRMHCCGAANEGSQAAAIILSTLGLGKTNTLARQLAIPGKDEKYAWGKTMTFFAP